MGTINYFCKATSLLVLVFSIYSQEGKSQSFIKSELRIGETENPGVNIYYEDVLFADYDNDRDMDIFLLRGSESKLLKNDGTDTFSDIFIPVPGILEGAADWGDYDRDGDLDLIVTGYDQETNRVYLIENLGDDQFQSRLMNFFGVRRGLNNSEFSSGIKWFDFNNDAILDLIMCGQDRFGNHKASLFMQSEYGYFLESRIELPDISGVPEIIDFDRDGDMDVYVSCGYNESYILFNEGGEGFKETIFRGISVGNVSWGDYNSDGFSDLLITGTHEPRLYLNQSGNTILNHPITLPEIEYGVGDFVDFDLDGDLDIIMLADLENDSFVSVIQINNGHDPAEIIEVDLPGLSGGAINMVDIDGDQILDVFILGAKRDPFRKIQELYYRRDGISNAKPMMPSDLTSEIINGTAYLSWLGASDQETDNQSLRYNLSIGTSTWENDILVPMADIEYGFLRTSPNHVHASDTFFIVNNLKPGRYYWSVQTVDNSSSGSFFSTEGEFDVPSPFTSIELDQDWVTNLEVGDIDGDSDMDLIASIERDEGPITRIYKNNGSGAFTVTDSLNSYWWKMAWGDYDRDNDLDILLNEIPYLEFKEGLWPTSEVVIFQNDGSGSFNRIASTIPVGPLGDVDWRDMDNDCDLDILALNSTGPTDDLENSLNIYECVDDTVYRLGIQFPDQLSGFGGFKAFDLDNNFDQDILWFGTHSTTGYFTEIYENNGNWSFSLAGKLDEMQSGNSYITDSNNDGKADILLSGNINDKGETVLFTGTGNLTFDKVSVSFLVDRAMIKASNWSDLNHDGKSDYITGSYEKLKIYQNKGLNEFEDIVHGIEESDIYLCAGTRLADLNSDGRLDIITFGPYGINWYRNNSNIDPLQVMVPHNLNSRYNQKGIQLTWDYYDIINNTEPDVTFNVRVGSSPGAYDIVSPLSDPVSGTTWTRKFGNCQYAKGFRIDSLAIGVYYWSVQTIGSNKLGGTWTPEQNFEILPIVVDFQADTVCQDKAIHFIDESLVRGEAVDSWDWEFGGGSSTEQNPVFAFHDAGVHDVTLMVSRGGENFMKTKQVVVIKAPEVLYIADEVCQGEFTSFSNQSLDKGLHIAAWQWNFDDGISSSSRDPQPHGYVNPGTYNVELVAVADNGCSDTINKVVSVMAKPEKDLTVVGTPCVDPGFTLRTNDAPSYTYQWKYKGIDINGASQASFQPGQTGDYSVVVNSPCGEVSASYTVSEPAISINAEGIPCLGSDYVLRTVDRESYTYQWRLHGANIPGAKTASHNPSKQGEYSVVVQTPCGEFTTSYNVGFLVGPEKPELHIRGPEVWYLACSNDSADTHEWYHDGNLIEGATEPIYLPAERTGMYEVKIANGGECFTASDPVYLPGSLTSIEEDPFTGLKIYPNPSPGVFNIEMDNSIMGELLIDIFSEQGSKIINIKFLKETSHFVAQVDLSAQPAGMYMIGLKIEEYMAKRKLLVE